MNYLTVRPQTVNAGGKCNLTEIRIVGDGATVNHDECEVWALQTGNQVLDVYGQLVRKMRNFHMAGNFDNGAVYVMDTEDVVRVCTSLLGPSDRERYRALQAMEAGRLRHVAAQREAEFGQFLTDLLDGVLKIMWTVLRGIGSIVFKMLLVLLMMRWMHRRRR